MDVDARAMMRDLQQQILMISTKSAENAGMVEALQQKVAELEKKLNKPELKAVE